jgi:hypothetical protein
MFGHPGPVARRREGARRAADHLTYGQDRFPERQDHYPLIIIP